MFDTMTEALARQNGLVIREGKTKLIARRGDDVDDGNVISKNDVTAGDGAKHDIIPGKAALATQTTCNVFRLLKACEIPVAFTEQVNSTVFSAPLCTMFPYEVVIRREAHGSYIDRNPHLPKGHHFPRLVLEFNLKTKGKIWKGAASGTEYPLQKDDPLMEFDYDEKQIKLFYPGFTSEERKTAPKGALVGQKAFLSLPLDEVFTKKNEQQLIEEMGKNAKRTFLILEKAWQLEGRTLVDLKVEFGLSGNGVLLLADVIDNDSWRVVDVDGQYLDKQRYRDGNTPLDAIKKLYEVVAEITGHFRLPTQQVIVWRGSEKDDISPVVKTLDALSGGCSGAASRRLKLTISTCSIHKEPVRGLSELHRLVQQVPDAVLIALIGRSNGAGPILSASTTVPVITVPASFKDFPEDAWSSLRTPSNVPVTTVLDPSNAAMAAIEILALHNPFLYMFLREQVEERLINTVQI
ncbi:MAG: phosphoribosylaminoimidazolesuccinocarboxamide synthase [Patescibacteria group bacterium]